MCQACSRPFQEWLVTLKFPQGKKVSSPWLGGTISSLGSGTLGQLYRVFLPWWPLGNLSTSLPVGPPLGSLPSLLITWEVCRKSDPSSTLLQFGGKQSGKEAAKT